MAVVRFDGTTLIRTQGRFSAAATQLTFAARLAFSDLGPSQWLFSPPIAAGPEGGSFKLHSSWLPFWSASLLAAGIAAGDAFSLMLAIDTGGGLSGGRTGKLWINGAEAQAQSGVGDTPVNLAALDIFGFFWSPAVCPAVEVTDWVWIADAALDPPAHWASFFDDDDRPRALPVGGSVGGVTPGLYIKGNATQWNSGVDENGNGYAVTAPSGAATGGVVLDVSSGAVEAAGQTLAAVSAAVAGAAEAGSTHAGPVLPTGSAAIGGLAAGGAGIPGRSAAAVAWPIGGTGRGSAGVAGGHGDAALSLHPGATRAGANASGEVLGRAVTLAPGTAVGARSPSVAGRLLASAASLVAGRAGAASLSRREGVLTALFAALQTAKPDGAVLLRNAALPERVPAAGLLILRDGDPGEPAVTMSPLRYHYQHRAEVEAVVQSATDRDATFDMLAAGVSVALTADRTLGCLCDWVEAEAPHPVDLAVDGAATLKAAVIVIVLHYASANPLG